MTHSAGGERNWSWKDLGWSCDAAGDKKFLKDGVDL